MKDIHAQSDENNFPLSPNVIKLIKNPDMDTIKYYNKQPKLIEFLSKKYKLPMDRILIGNGVTGLIHVFFDRLPKKTKVLIPDFGYPYYFRLSKLYDLNYTEFKIIKSKNQFYYDIKDLIEKSKNKDYLILSDPESPLGFSIKNDDLELIFNKVNKKTIIILDLEQEGIRTKNIKDVKKLINKYPNLIIFKGFSKYYGLAGLRIGYALLGKQIRKKTNFVDRYLGYNNQIQEIAIQSIKDNKYYKKIAKEIRIQKEYLEKELTKLNYRIYKTDYIATLLEVPKNKIPKLKKEFIKNKILVGWLKGYRETKHKASENLLRITITPEKDTKKIIAVFKKIN